MKEDEEDKGLKQKREQFAELIHNKIPALKRLKASGAKLPYNLEGVLHVSRTLNNETSDQGGIEDTLRRILRFVRR